MFSDGVPRAVPEPVVNVMESGGIQHKKELTFAVECDKLWVIWYYQITILSP